MSAAEVSKKKLRAKRTLPPREDQIKSLQTEDEFDVLIIGGGATGAGCALDSVTRGIKQPYFDKDIVILTRW